MFLWGLWIDPLYLAIAHPAGLSGYLSLARR